MTTLYIATVHVVVDADSEAEACDAIAEGLRGNLLDWGYERDADGVASPDTLGTVAKYEEGDFYAMARAIGAIA